MGVGFVDLFELLGDYLPILGIHFRIGLDSGDFALGFDDGFKGRGAVAKKITALAGLNDGIVSELEAKRHHAVLAATPEVAEMLVDRVDGAMLGRKTIEISVTD